MFYKKIKTIIDFLISLIALIITSPLFLVIILLIKIDSKGPVFFIQNRAGKNERIFKFLKFRTMVKGAENMGLGIGVVKNDSRITRVGKFLREWTLDELPQLINILKGDMSLIGPRPLPPYQGQNSEFKKLWEKRISIKPGLVSIVDIKGRNLVSWEKRLEYDSWYIDHLCLWLDFKILVLGVFAVLSRKGVYGEDGENKPLK